MTLALLILAYLVLAGTDVFFTRRIISVFGKQAELNGMVRWCVSKLGLTQGLIIGILCPTLTVLLAVLIISPKNPSVGISFFTGMRTMLFLRQLQVHFNFKKLLIIKKNF